MQLSTIRNILLGIYVLVVLAFSAVAKAEVASESSASSHVGSRTKA